METLVGATQTLTAQGVPPGIRKLHPLMAGVSKDRFSHLTQQERDALFLPQSTHRAAIMAALANVHFGSKADISVSQ